MIERNLMLERAKFAMRKSVALELFDGLTVDRIDVYLNDTIAALEICVLKEVLTQKVETVEVKYPVDWIEAIKERFLPGFIKDFWPVKMKEHRLEAQILYPYIIPGERNYLRVTID